MMLAETDVAIIPLNELPALAALGDALPALFTPDAKSGGIALRFVHREHPQPQHAPGAFSACCDGRRLHTLVHNEIL